MTGNSDKCLNVAFSPETLEIAACCMDGKIRIWDSENGSLSREIDTGEGSKALAFAAHLNVGLL